MRDEIPVVTNGVASTGTLEDEVPRSQPASEVSAFHRSQQKEPIYVNHLNDVVHVVNHLNVVVQYCTTPSNLASVW